LDRAPLEEGIDYWKLLLDGITDYIADYRINGLLDITVGVKLK
jgi:hypothetical protein